MSSTTKDKSSEWHDMFCNGYNKLWYLRATLRWTTALGAAVDLIVFGVVWSDQDTNNSLRLYGPDVFGVIGPLCSFLVSIFAVVLLFLIRRNTYLNPRWLLTSDLLAGLTLTVDVAWFGSLVEYWNYETSWTSLRVLQVPWGFSFAIVLLHVVTFSICIWETHIYRRMVRTRRTNGTTDLLAKLESGKSGDKYDNELLRTSEDIELGDTQVIEAPGEGSSARVEIPDTFRVELPDGRVIELPAGCRIELPAESPVELPATNSSKLSFDSFEERILTHAPHVLPVELECPTSSVRGLESSHDSPPSYKSGS